MDGTAYNRMSKQTAQIAYRRLQMADGRSVDMIPFEIASRTIASRPSVKGLLRFFYAFSSLLMNVYLVSVLEANQCTHYRDDIKG